MVIIVGLFLLLGEFMFIEFLVPAVAFGLYLTIRAMLRQAARHHERCEGKLGLSMAFSALWTTVYVAPIGMLIWCIQVLMASR